jgi:hypothetical protein
MIFSIGLSAVSDDFELSNLGEIIENLVLHTISKIGVIFICADVFEGKNRNTLFGRYGLGDSLVNEKSSAAGK